MAKICVSFVQHGRWGAGVQKVFSARYAHKLIDSVNQYDPSGVGCMVAWWHQAKSVGGNRQLPVEVWEIEEQSPNITDSEIKWEGEIVRVDPIQSYSSKMHRTKTAHIH